MSLKEFQEKTEKPEFIYRPDPGAKDCYILLQFAEEKSEYQPVGRYEQIDMGQDSDITVKNVENLVTLLNGKTRLHDLSNLTSGRLLYNIIDDTEESETITIMLRVLEKEGVSKENAALKIEKGVFRDRSKSS